MNSDAMFVFLLILTFCNLGGAVAIGRVIKNYGALANKVKTHDEILNPKAHGTLIAKVEEHDDILHNGIIDKLDEIAKEQAKMESCPEKLDALVSETANLRGIVTTYMKMKK